MYTILKFFFFVFVSAILVASCSSGPKPIDYGSDGCYYCKMTVVDKQHAAQAVTDKGKAYMFDAIECLVPFIQENTDMQFAHLLVNDFDHPGKLINAQDANYLISKNLPSPMGAFLTAFGTETSAQKMLADRGGQLYNWKELKEHLRR